MIFTLGKYTLDIDVEKNKAFYRNYTYECNCDACMNYKMSVKETFPDVAELFNKFGLDISKPGEVYDLDSKSNILLYGGWYHISGKIIKSDLTKSSDEDMYQLTDNFNISFSTHCTLLKEDFPKPCFEMYIDTNIPWRLDKDNVYEK